MTRAERAAAKRQNQIRRALKRYRAKQRERKASVAPEPAAEKDPVWGNVAATPTPVPAPPAHAPIVPPEPEPVPKQEIPYVRRAARGPKPEKPVPLARAHDPRTGRRRVRIVIGDKTIEGEVGGDSIEGWGFEN